MSTALAIRDAVFERIAALPGWAVTRKTPVPILQPDKLPAVSIFVIEEQADADGDFNVGPVQLLAEITIGISVMRGFKQTGELEGDIDADDAAIRDALLTDPDFTRHGPGALIEGVTRLTSRRTFPKDGETFLAELRLQMTFATRVAYTPVIPDDYEKTVLTIRPSANPDAPPITTVIDAADD